MNQYHPWNNCAWIKIIESLQADVLCIQEVKATTTTLPVDTIQVPGYLSFYSLTGKGYSGVATYIRQDWIPIEAKLECFSDWSCDEFTRQELDVLDSEGRCVVLDLGFFVLFNIYFPNQGATDERLRFKMDYSRAVQQRIQDLIQQGRRVMLVGDLNVVAHEIDHCNPSQSIKDHQLETFDDLPARKWLNSFLSPKGKMVDTFRAFYPEQTCAYTVWNTLLNARPANYGTRIDYVLVDSTWMDWVKDAFILSDVMGSDHCPVGVELFDTHPQSGQVLSQLLKGGPTIPKTCTQYWPNFPGKQKQITDFFGKQRGSAPIPPMRKRSKPEQKKLDSFFIKKTKNEAVDDSSIQIQGSSASDLGNKIEPVGEREHVIDLSQVDDQNQHKEFSLFQKQDMEQLILPENGLNQRGQHQVQENGLNQQGQHQVQENGLNQRGQHQVQENGLNQTQHDIHENTSPSRFQISQEAWKAIFQTKKAPFCHHGEPSVEWTVKKSGPNKGRRFYLCARPVGTTPQHRCDFFEWKIKSTRK